MNESMSWGSRFERSEFERPAAQVAPLLLGARFAHTTAEGTVAIRVTEVEAYEGQGQDPGSHAHRGPGRRNAVMFGEPGRLYTYFTYGMHVCANVVCLPEGAAAAVLLRGGEVIEGEDIARARRGDAVLARDLARGPARLVRALAIPLSDGGADLLSPPYSLDRPDRPVAFQTSVRTGVSGPGGEAAYPWRFFLPGEPTVSPYRAAVPRRRPPAV